LQGQLDRPLAPFGHRPDLGAVHDQQILRLLYLVEKLNQPLDVDILELHLYAFRLVQLPLVGKRNRLHVANFLFDAGFPGNALKVGEKGEILPLCRRIPSASFRDAWKVSHWLFT